MRGRTKKKDSEFANVIGRKFGYWEIKGFEGRDAHGHVKYDCECICGHRKSVMYGSLTSGQSKSCGCMRKELTAISLERNR